MTDVGDRPDIELFGPVLQMIRVPNLDAVLIVRLTGLTKINRDTGLLAL